MAECLRVVSSICTWISVKRKMKALNLKYPNRIQRRQGGYIYKNISVPSSDSNSFCSRLAKFQLGKSFVRAGGVVRSEANFGPEEDI